MHNKVPTAGVFLEDIGGMTNRFNNTFGCGLGDFL